MGTRGGRAQVLAAALALGFAVPAIAAPALDLYYQRSLMLAADKDCRLFASDIGQALAASAIQARSAALRSGAGKAELADLQARAGADALTAGCRSPTIAAAARQVRAAFVGYARLEHMDFPGEFAGWSAERSPAGTRLEWRVSQRVRFGWDELVFGVAGRGSDRPLMAVASFADCATPYAARLVLRDTSVTEGPFLDWRQSDLAGHLPIDARLPPRASTRTFAAEAMSPAGSDLAAKEMTDAWAFRFPDAAKAALADLDPREAVAVEFLFAGDSGGEDVRTAYIEVGDFAAAQAFERIAQR
ncbi:MAG TPA: hypothetical protein VME40_10415 [Caulobacteraceae bacterium]|nr:hypothetical protein [Caulobacteraceae bacterium]